jgi:hypothetical protein
LRWVRHAEWEKLNKYSILSGRPYGRSQLEKWE